VSAARRCPGSRIIWQGWSSRSSARGTRLGFGPKPQCRDGRWRRVVCLRGHAPERRCRSGSPLLPRHDRRNPGSKSDRRARLHRRCGALMRSCGGCVGVDAPEGAGAPVNAPHVIAKECAEQFKLMQARPRLVHLLALRRRLRLQPLDRMRLFAPSIPDYCPSESDRPDGGDDQATVPTAYRTISMGSGMISRASYNHRPLNAAATRASMK